MKRIPGLRKLERARVRFFGYPSDTIHYLHISKTAGSQIRSVIEQVNSTRIRGRIFVHSHEMRYAHIPDKAQYFFSIRDPIKRFVSGFYWRKTKGAPHFNWEWTPCEKLAFSQFEHANDLAEALFRNDELGEKAAAAIKSIGHTSRNQIDNFTLRGHALDISPPIWILRQERLQADVAELLRRIGHNRPIDLNSDAPFARKQSYADVPALSERAMENLRVWYAQDIQFVRLCHAWLKSNGA